MYLCWVAPVRGIEPRARRHGRRRATVRAVGGDGGASGVDRLIGPGGDERLRQSRGGDAHIVQSAAGQ